MHSPSLATTIMSSILIIGTFAIFGLINNLVYVIILSAALDMNTTPGLTALANILPSLIVKILVPYLNSTKAIFGKRVLFISITTSIGMLIVALSSTVPIKLIGIALTSTASSGVGDMTFLQLAAQYRALAYYASGTGLAGVIGSSAWLILRKMGIVEGLLVSATFPTLQLITYFCMLPRAPSNDDSEDGTLNRLSIEEKKEVGKDLLRPYMLPLFSVYLFEYTINQGVAPALSYDNRTNRDTYPVYQLLYQIGVFLSRSSHLFNVGHLSRKQLAIPSVIQGCIFLLLLIESVVKQAGYYAVCIVILIEGLMGGLSYVNVFHHTSMEYKNAAAHTREYAIGLVSLSDGVGIVLASLFSIGLGKLLT